MIEKQEETEMRLKLLSPGEMDEDQKQTYDESIAGKRGAPPPPMMAWLNSPEMARHATRLGQSCGSTPSFRRNCRKSQSW